MTFPDFAKPPVVEVVCGALFDPLVEFKTPHLGRLWDRLPRGFGKVSEVTPLAPVIESFKTRTGPTFIGEPVLATPRVWFENESGDQLIQVQRDRFLVNWRKTAAEHAYPRYPKVCGAFEEQFELFRGFLQDTFGHPPTPRQYELTYINHVPADDGWSTLEELGEVLPDLAWRRDASRFLPAPERLDARLAFPFPDRKGRLHARVQNGVRNVDQMPVLVVELTARGFQEDRRAWFDLAHEWIVKGFCDLTGKRIQDEVWERRT